MTNFINISYLSDVDFYVTTEEFKKIFRNSPKFRKLLFGRKDFKSESLLEQILSIALKKSEVSTELFDEALKYIWNDFRLWEKPEILTMVSRFKLMLNL